MFEDNGALAALHGPRGEHLRVVESELRVRLHERGNEISLLGDEDGVLLAERVLGDLYDLARRGTPLGAEDFRRAIAIVRENKNADLRAIFDDTVLVAARGRAITPKGLAQKRYVDAMRAHDVV